MSVVKRRKKATESGGEWVPPGELQEWLDPDHSPPGKLLLPKVWELQDRVLLTLVAAGFTTVLDLEDATGWPVQVVRNSLRRLYEYGWVDRVPHTYDSGTGWKEVASYYVVLPPLLRKPEELNRLADKSYLERARGKAPRPFGYYQPGWVSYSTQETNKRLNRWKNAYRVTFSEWQRASDTLRKKWAAEVGKTAEEVGLTLSRFAEFVDKSRFRFLQSTPPVGREPEDLERDRLATLWRSQLERKQPTKKP